MALYTPAPGAENPSPAFLAGQSHGAALAVQHHAAAAKAPKPAKAAAPTTLNDLLAQAQGIAQQQTNQQVAAIKAQQALYNNQAQSRSQQEVAASQAAAQLIAQLGLGDQTAASYNTAAQNIAGLAQGFSGQTQTDATNAASQVQAQLAKLGAPSGSAQTSTGQTSNPAALGNVLYGLGGYIPGNVLETTGQAQAAYQRQLPLSALSYGQQMAAGELAAGQQNADALTPNIVNARAQEPSLYQSILSSLNSTLTNQALAQSLIGDRNATTLGKQGLAPSGAPLPGYQIGSNGTVYKVPAGYTLNPNGTVTKIPGPPKPAAAAKPPSASTVKYWNQLAATYHSGSQPKYHYAPTDPKAVNGWIVVPGTGGGQKDYQQAVAGLVAAGAPLARATQIANTQYAPGEAGRPYSIQQKQTLAKAAAKKVVNAEINPATGRPYTVVDAVTAGAKIGIPAGTITKAIHTTKAPGSKVPVGFTMKVGAKTYRFNGKTWVLEK